MHGLISWFFARTACSRDIHPPYPNRWEYIHPRVRKRSIYIGKSKDIKFCWRGCNHKRSFVWGSGPSSYFICFFTLYSIWCLFPLLEKGGPCYLQDNSTRLPSAQSSRHGPLAFAPNGSTKVLENCWLKVRTFPTCFSSAFLFVFWYRHYRPC